MRVLVTGGAGFIGSHVVDKLRDHGHEPVIYDLRPSPWPEHADVDTVHRPGHRRGCARGGAGRVATRSRTSRRWPTSTTSTPSRTTPSRSTPAAPPRCSRPPAGPASSASSTRRRSGSTATPRTTTVSETTLLPPPAHLYTATKLAGELYCKSYQELYGINYTILRFGIPYGPRAREAAVIPAFVNKAFAGEPLTLSGDGMQSRRFVYVEDLAEGVVAGLGDIAENRVYNLSSDEDVTIKQIAELVQEIVGNTEIVYGPARPGDLGSKIVLSDRARDELGWTASTPFSEGVRRYVEWRREQAAKKERRAPRPFSGGGRA